MMGVRIRYSYPCLFTQDEFTHGVPLSSEEYNVVKEHNYFDNRDPEEDIASQEPSILMGMPDNVYPQEHLYTLPPTNQAAISKQSENRGTSLSRSPLADISQQENIEHEQFHSSQPSTSKETSVSRSPLADVSQQENIETERFHSSQPSTSKGTPLVSRSPLADISQLENIEPERFHSSQPSTCKGKRVSWEDILYIYDLDNKSGHTKALPKLTADHVDPKEMKKMKVKVAAQVLSARTAAMLNYTHAHHQRLNTPIETMSTTAAVVLFFDELFDSVNGSPGQGRGKLRCAVKQDSAHIEFWRTPIKKLKKLNILTPKAYWQDVKAIHDMYGSHP